MRIQTSILTRKILLEKHNIRTQREMLLITCIELCKINNSDDTSDDIIDYRIQTDDISYKYITPNTLWICDNMNYGENILSIYTLYKTIYINYKIFDTLKKYKKNHELTNDEVEVLIHCILNKHIDLKQYKDYQIAIISS